MLTRLQEIQLKNQVQRVLHVPGNYNGGPLEMAVVMDAALSHEDAAAAGRQIAQVLKSMGDTFRNVRLNLVIWSADRITHELSALPHLIMGSAFRDYVSDKMQSADDFLCPEGAEQENRKLLEDLCANLKLFQARSRLVILVTREAQTHQTADAVRLRENLNPFLYRRLIILTENEVKPGISLLMHK